MVRQQPRDPSAAGTPDVDDWQANSSTTCTRSVGRLPFASIDNFALAQSSRQGAAYVQDEIRLRPWLIVNAGLRHDRYPRFNRTTPRGAVIVMPSANHSLKYL